MKYTEKISNKLNELLEKNYDAEKGYLNAAENVDSSRLKIFFKNRASERSDFAKNLRTEILSYGQIPEETGTFQGTMHRNWMSLKSLFSSNDEEAILEEAIRGEQVSYNEYTEILEEDAFAPSTRKLLEAQKQQIQSAINSLMVEEELA
ncbi:PA2169 family four-helix-bundle protein [Polaribacter vadi]|uniref:ferritin-like domain-containing protein n=1 Tax=Polaribacter TaxID=52959 RepID=UPI001C08F6FA|nr:MULTISPECIES: PA2169 family four-helix-bundle protein [Polaribacter]MBU3010604.1 PA2169 family four-helix-bundle protein [Polaribacter vadi]MDO6740415.1 PA2169 family four-helix-bundle protein [Polaribacter sp. 1_MG-2023]